MTSSRPPNAVSVAQREGQPQLFSRCCRRRLPQTCETADDNKRLLPSARQTQRWKEGEKEFEQQKGVGEEEEKKRSGARLRPCSHRRQRCLPRRCAEERRTAAAKSTNRTSRGRKRIITRILLSKQRPLKGQPWGAARSRRRSRANRGTRQGLSSQHFSTCAQAVRFV